MISAPPSFLGPADLQQLEEAEAWFARVLRPGPYRPRPAGDPRLLIMCMTPRSGSTALSGLLLATRMLGRGGERLNRTNAFLRRVVEQTPPRSRRHLLDMVMNSSRTENGVGQIKVDLPQILPFLLDPDCTDLLLSAHFIYLTRGDILGQAISRYRGIKTGIWHAARASATPGVHHAPKPGEARDGDRSTEAPYDHAAIYAQIERITQMMASYERIFALFGIRPLRISYEEVTADPAAVLARIAALVGVDPGPAGKTLSLDEGGFTRVSGRNNDELRSRFLAESRALLVRGRPAAAPPAQRPASAPALPDTPPEA